MAQELNKDITDDFKYIIPPNMKLTAKIYQIGYDKICFEYKDDKYEFQKQKDILDINGIADYNSAIYECIDYIEDYKYAIEHPTLFKIKMFFKGIFNRSSEWK